jgi:hypothetical protein
MLRNKRTVTWLAASVVLCGFLAVFSFAAPPDGKGGGNGGGGGSEEPTLPADLDVRYRVQFIPLPASAAENYVVHDVNDVYEAVGAYNDVDGFRVGYYYDASTPTDPALTVNEMISLPARWVNTSLVGINNHGAIVGMVRDSFGFNQCILIYPSQDGYSYEYEITSPVDTSGEMNSHFTQINDSGDIVGISWDGEGIGYAFAYHPRIFPLEGFRDFTFFGSPGARWNSMQVTNARLGTVRVGEDLFWFGFLDGQESLAQLPANERSPTSDGISHDGQITANEALVEKKGKHISYRYTPGVMVAGQYVWQGSLDDGYATLVNSAVGQNAVGDIVGFNEISGVRWMRHADHPAWDYLDLSAMVVFSSEPDEERWSLIPGQGARVWGMSDRDPIAGFGVLLGHYSSVISNTHAAYLLVPEIITP